MDETWSGLSNNSKTNMNFSIICKISKFYLILMDISLFMSDFIKPSVFKDIQEKLKFQKKILYMFRPMFLKFITMTVVNYELNF